MSEDDQPGNRPAPELPKEHLRAVVKRPGERLKEPTNILVPELTSETTPINFRADTTTVDCINGHLDRIYRLAPGFAITVSASIRSLIQRGAVAFAEDDKREQEDK